jgi:hypothetical protein
MRSHGKDELDLSGFSFIRLLFKKKSYELFLMAKAYFMGFSFILY